MNESALDSLLRRLGSGQQDQIAGPDAVAEANAVVAHIDWAGLAGDSPDWTAVVVVAGFHRQRSPLLAEPRRTDELRTALDLFLVAQCLVPGALPGLEARYRPPDGRPYNSVGLRVLDEAERTGDVAVAARAAFLFQRAVDDAAPEDPHLATYLSNLGAAMMFRFERTGDQQALGAAIDAFRASTHAAGHDRPAYLANLGAALATHYEQTGARDALDEALAVQRQAADEAPAGSADRLLYLSNLGTSLTTAFTSLGDERLIQEAIAILTTAVRETEAGSPDLPARLVNLGRSQLAAFEHTGDSELLDAGTTALRESVTATAEDDPELPARLSNVAGAMVLFHQRFPNAKWLDIAEEALTEALRHPHRQRVSHLSNLGTVHLFRYRITKDTADLDAAIANSREALALAPDDHPILASLLSNLGNAHLRRFQAGGDPDDLAAARSRLADAVARAPANDPDRCAYLTNQADAAERPAALGLYRAAVSVSTAPPLERAHAARSLGRLAALAGDERDMAVALDAFSDGITLLTEAAWHGLGRLDQTQVLTEFSGMASDAAACAVERHDPVRAMELLEQGRAVLFGRVLDSRTEDSLLEQRHPRLAAELHRTYAELERTDDWQSGLEPASDRAARFRRLATRRQALIEEIRALPDLSGFLLPAGFAELRTAATAGPVVVVNVSDIRCDALVVTVDDVEVVPLHPLTTTDVAHCARAFVEVVNATRVFGELPASRRTDVAESLRQILDWLWRMVAQPVLDRLHVPEQAAGWPRLWWCPTGLLTLLPLHAAQTYLPERLADVGVPDHVISSYTPTLRTLIAARRPATPAPARCVAVGLPTTPGQRDLKHVERELATVTYYLPATTLVGPAATRAAVSESLRTHACLHFVGHSGQDLRHPDRAELCLVDGNLTMLDISRLRLTGAELAYLSSCEGAVPVLTLPDETIHLAAALQIAG